MLSILGGLWSGLIQILRFWMDHLLFINIVLSIVIVFFERREQRTVWTWLLLLYFIPILGIFLYHYPGRIRAQGPQTAEVSGCGADEFGCSGCRVQCGQ